MPKEKHYKNSDKTFISSISQNEFPESEKVHAKIIRKSIFDLIQKDHKAFTRNSLMSVSELNVYRQKYIAEYLMSEVGELTAMEDDVLKTLQNHEILSSKLGLDSDATNFTFGQRLADKIASFGGSWKFIIIFGVFILIWIFSNIIFLLNKGFSAEKAGGLFAAICNFEASQLQDFHLKQGSLNTNTK